MLILKGAQAVNATGGDGPHTAQAAAGIAGILDRHRRGADFVGVVAQLEVAGPGFEPGIP